MKLIRSPGFNRIAARTHSKVQKMKLQWSGTEEEIRQSKEQEKLLKDAEEKFKSLDEPSKGSGMAAVFWANANRGFREGGG